MEVPSVCFELLVLDLQSIRQSLARREVCNAVRITMSNPDPGNAAFASIIWDNDLSTRQLSRSIKQPRKSLKGSGIVAQLIFFE
jgi:hypothetical protein